MRTLADVIDEIAYHPATPEVASKYAKIREAAIELASVTWDLIPDGANKTLALRGLQQFVMQANCAIAMTTPADREHADVARVLPETGKAPAPVASSFYGIDEDDPGKLV